MCLECFELKLALLHKRRVPSEWVRAGSFRLRVYRDSVDQGQASSITPKTLPAPSTPRCNPVTEP